eukprot:scaffold83634_cov66-Phaeocystis_antarctica.AAC.2
MAMLWPPSLMIASPGRWNHSPLRLYSRDARVRALERARAALAVLVADGAVRVAAVVLLGLGRARQQVGHDDHRGRERKCALAAHERLLDVHPVVVGLERAYVEAQRVDLHRRGTAVAPGEGEGSGEESSCRRTCGRSARSWSWDPNRSWADRGRRTKAARRHLRAVRVRVWARARVEGWLEVERVCLEAVRARARARARARVGCVTSYRSP